MCGVCREGAIDGQEGEEGGEAGRRDILCLPDVVCVTGSRHGLWHAGLQVAIVVIGKVDIDR